jgi:uncharacterized repeat protein (TIGR01451 family)
LLLLAVLAALGAFLTASSALAVHDHGLFELDVVDGVGDGNTIDEAAPGDDWENVFNDTSSAFATSFIVDTFANNPIVGFPTPENSFFTGGGSKDTECLQDPCATPLGGAGGPWIYDTVNDVVPDKNDILHAFAAAYDDPDDGHTIFYFGLDTYSVQGASNAGFWFFRQRVGLALLGDPSAEQGFFTGEHSDGDVFVAVAYTQGGKVGTVDVYQWDSTLGPGSKPLGPQLVFSAADCADAAADDDVCGVINQTPGEDPPWNYLNKDGGSTYESAAFVEFGLDINAVLGTDEIGCFSSFLAETRSSQSLTAQLKDFALGEFPVCGIDVVKESDGLSKPGDDVDYTITVENTGRATLYKQSITDSLQGDLTSDPGCGASLAPGDTCTIQYSRTVGVNDPDPLENKVTIVYTEFADPQSQEFTDEYTATVNLFQPDIAIDKTVQDDTLAFVDGPITVLQGATVNYKVELSNESSVDTPPLTCTTTDAKLGIDETGIPVEVTAQHTFEDLADPDFECVLNGGTYDCTNTADSICTLSDPFVNTLLVEDSVTVSVVPRDVAFTVTKTGDPFTKDGDTVSYEVGIDNASNLSLNLDSIRDFNNVGEVRDLTDPANYDTSDCGSTLSPDDGQPAGDDECTVTFSRMTLGTDPDPIRNEVVVGVSDAFGGSGEQGASWLVDIIHPDLTVSKDCLPATPVPPGTVVSFRIDTVNTGDAELVLTSVDDTEIGELLTEDVDLDERGGVPCTETDFDNGASTGCFRIEADFTVGNQDVTNTVTVLAKLNERFDLPNTFSESDMATCEVEVPGITRTWGFWKTHGSDGTEFDPPVEKGYTCYVAETNVGFLIDLGWTQLNNCEDVFGLFWENKAQCSQTEKTQIQGSRQFLAALLNFGAFGTPVPDECKSKRYADLSTTDLFGAMRAALAGGKRQDINKLGGILACYNESGDDQAIMDGVAVPHADPNGTRAIADFDLVTCGK